MGSAIVYCAQCNSMLRDMDFGKGGAVRVDGRPYCTMCASERFPAEQLEFGLPVQVEILPDPPKPPVLDDSSRRGTRVVRIAEPPRKSGAGLWLGLAAGLVLVVVVAIAASAGGKPKPPAAPPAEVVVTAEEPPPRPPPPAAPPPPVVPPRTPEDPVAAETARLESDLRSALGKEEYGRALEMLEAAKSRLPVAGRLEEVRKTAAELYAAIEKTAVDAKRRGAEADVRAATDRVGRWRLEPQRAALEKALAAVVPPAPPPPPPPPPARPVWADSFALAASRDYATAIADLERAKLEEDAANLRQVAALQAEAARLLALWPRQQKLAIEVFGEDGAPRKVEGTLLRADGLRLEIATAGNAVLVPYGEITAPSLAEVFKNRRTRKPGDVRTAGLLCLLERDPASARKVLGEPPPAIPEKYWEHAASAAPADPREAEARRLFAEAEREPDAPAALKSGQLLKDFAGCAVVRRNAALLAARAQGGREYFFAPEGLAGAGVFRWARSARREAYWTAGADVDAARRKESYVELEFSALPGVEYEVWALVGGCCVETTTFHAQAGEQVGTDASTPVKHGVSSTRHRTHPAGRREPTLWGWAKLPFVKAAAAGPQKVRLLGEQAGFSVAYAWVTALDRPPPRESEIKDLERSRALTPGDRTFARDPRLEAGLIGFWRFDEGSGATAADASRSGNSGTLAGPAWAAGVSGGALSFDGADDRVTLASVPAATDTFTIAFWANPSGERKWTEMATDGITGTSEQRYAIYPSIHASAGAGVSVGVNGVSVFEHSGSYLPSLLVHDAAIVGWTHVAVVYKDRQPRLYLNGVFVREGLKSTRAVVPGWHFGSDGSAYGPYKGLLDEVRTYDRALSEGEISALMVRPRTILKNP